MPALKAAQPSQQSLAKPLHLSAVQVFLVAMHLTLLSCVEPIAARQGSEYTDSYKNRPILAQDSSVDSYSRVIFLEHVVCLYKSPTQNHQLLSDTNLFFYIKK